MMTVSSQFAFRNGLASGALLLLMSVAHAGEWTWVDPGNNAKAEDYIGGSGGEVCVQAVDAKTRQPVSARVWRHAEGITGGPKKKELGNTDEFSGKLKANTKGLRYEVYIENTTGRPIYIASCEASVRTIKIIDKQF